MSTEDINEDFGDEELVPKKKGMSTLTKVLLGLGCGGILGIVVCCGAFTYFASQMMKITDDPNKIAALREEIIGIDIPDTLPPVMGGDMNFFAFKVKMVGYGEAEGHFLLLMGMDIPDANPDQMDQQLKMQANQQLNQQGKNVQIQESETRTLMIDGEERNFVFAKGTMTTKDGQTSDVRQVTGTFRSRNGVGLVIYIIPEEEWNEEQTIQMLESIHK
ncbi:MAG: hypothetical protein KDA69_05185 [Planctomycetaceae bacterium]|nr:hypothetical protein [Planctomycetaceae bacterium]MCA9029811.1 hypothetical protein [Planctomycetaceae bacterium]MCA9043692.1 hypothetical protein [Planctomycetaceae bacterium]MCB9950486.1 hypothetical protein [Planctomycetaceae bacterium]